jgi:hypothetical protein
MNREWSSMPVTTLTSCPPVMPLAIQVYAEASGHRTVFCCPHTFGSSGGGRITSTAARLHDHEVSLEY